MGYAPELEKKSISVAFDYYGSFEKDVEVLVSRLEDAYMELNGLKSIHSVSEPGRGYIVCQFSDKTRLEDAYVQISETIDIEHLETGQREPGSLFIRLFCSITAGTIQTPVIISVNGMLQDSDGNTLEKDYVLRINAL